MLAIMPRIPPTARQFRHPGSVDRLRHRTTRLFRNLIQLLLLNVCHPILLILEFVFHQSEMMLSLIHKGVRQVIWTDPN